MPLDDTISGNISRPQGNFPEAVDTLNLTPQEQYLYQHHLNNLYGSGKVTQPNGDISTLLQANVGGPGGQSYNIPTVWYGRALPVPLARSLAARAGWDKWPSYPDAGEAERRYNDMHQFMERDTGDYRAMGQASGGRVRVQEGGDADAEAEVSSAPALVAPTYGMTPGGIDPLSQTLATMPAGLLTSPAAQAARQDLAKQLGTIIDPKRPTPYDELLRQELVRFAEMRAPRQPTAIDFHGLPRVPTGQPLVQPAPGRPDPSAAPPIDFHGLPRIDPATGKPFPDQPSADQEPGFLHLPVSLYRGAARALQEVAMAPQAHPTPLPQETAPEAQPWEWSDIWHLRRAANKLAYDIGYQVPELGFGLAAGAATEAVLPEVPGSGLLGGAAAAGMAHMIRGIGPILADELQKTPQDPDGAWERARNRAVLEGGITAAGWAAFGLAPPPFRDGIKNMVLTTIGVKPSAAGVVSRTAFQALGVQPTVAMVGKVAENIQQGRPIGEGVPQAGGQAIPGTAIPMIGTHGAAWLAGRLAGPAQPTPAGAAQAPPAGFTMPPVGSTITLRDPRGGPDQTFTVQGHIGTAAAQLEGEDGTPENIAAGILAQRMVSQTPPDPAAQAAAVDPFQQVRTAVEQFRADNGRAPSTEELQNITGLEPAEIGRHVDTLRAAGEFEPPPEGAAEGASDEMQNVTITEGGRRRLHDLGYTDEQVRNLRPEDALNIIRNQVRAPPVEEAGAVGDQQEREAEQASEAAREKLEETAKQHAQAADTMDQNIDDVFAGSLDRAGQTADQTVTDQVAQAQQTAEAAPTGQEIREGTLGARPAAETMQQTDVHFGFAQGLGLVDDIARLAGEGRSANEIIVALRNRMQPIWDAHAAAGQTPGMALNFANEIVRAVRLKLGIPDPANVEEFHAWQRQQQENAAAAKPPPTRAPREPERLEVNTGKDSKGNPVWRVPLSPDDPDYMALRKEAVDAGGRYLAGRQNFAFNTQEAAEKFAARVREVLEARLSQEQAAQVEAEAATTGEIWRPVEPGEIFAPGAKFRMNMTTGAQETTAPAREIPAPEAEVVAPASPVTEAAPPAAAIDPATLPQILGEQAPELPPLHQDVTAFSDPATGENRWSVPAPFDANHPDYAYFARQARNLDGRFIDGRFVFDDPDNASQFAEQLEARGRGGVYHPEPHELDPLIQRMRDPATGNRVYAIPIERRPDNLLFRQLVSAGRRLGGIWNARLRGVVFPDALRANEFANLAWGVFNADPTLRPVRDVPNFFRRILDWARGIGGDVKTAADAQQAAAPLEPVSELPFQDLTEDYQTWAAAHPDVEPTFVAAAWALGKGLETGTEHSVIRDPVTGEVFPTTSGAVDYVKWPTSIAPQLADRNNRFFSFHNHPSGRPSSPGDFATFAPGVGWGTVISHQGISALALTDRMRDWLYSGPRTTVYNLQNNTLQKLWYHVFGKVTQRMVEAFDRGEITDEDGTVFASDMVHRVMDAAGIIDHISSYDTPMPDSVMRGQSKTEFIRELAHEVAQEHWGEDYNANDVDARANRAARVLRPGEGLAEVSRRAAEIAESGGPTGEGRDLAREPMARGPGEIEGPFPEDIRIGSEPQLIDHGGRGPLLGEAELAALQNAHLRDEAIFGPGGRFPGLINTRFPDATDAFTKEALLTSGMLSRDENPFDARVVSDRLGTSPNSPGGRNPRFNLIFKDAMMARTLANKDPRSRPFLDAWRNHWYTVRTFVNKYSNMLLGKDHGRPSWTGAPLALQSQVFQALALVNDQGLRVATEGPLDPIIVHNKDAPWLRTPVGQTIVLADPRAIQMFRDVRRTLDAIPPDFIRELGHKYAGYQGEPDVYHIKQAIDAATSDRDRAALRDFIPIAQALQHVHRTGYVPQMRYGDTFLRITPEAGTPARGRHLGWDGVPGGFPPTTWFSLFDSQKGWQKFIQGEIPEDPPNLQEKIDEAFQQLGIAPEDRAQYRVEHGWLADLMQNEKQLADLDIGALDKLMMAIANPIRDEIQDRLRADPNNPVSEADAKRQAGTLYKNIVDRMFREVQNERTAGPLRHRKNIPGYSLDLGKSITNYIRWGAHHNANIRTRDDIDNARTGPRGVANHPTPAVRQYWADWEARHAEFLDPLFGPAHWARQYAFITLLGANFSSMVKFLSHTFLLGWPTLSTGLNPLTVGGTYLNALSRIVASFRPSRRGLTFDPMSHARDDDERGVIQRALDSGRLDPEFTHEMGGGPWAGEETIGGRFPWARNVLDFLSSNIRVADQATRTATLLSSYRTALRYGMDKINDTWRLRRNPRTGKLEGDGNWTGETPEEFAHFMLARTSGEADFNRVPMLTRGWFRRLVFQFKNFEANYLSTMLQMTSSMGVPGKITAGIMAASLWGLGGVYGLPFAQDIEEATSWMWGGVTTLLRYLGFPIGLTPSLESVFRSGIDSMLGNGWGDQVLHGPMRDLGVDLQGFGFGNLISRDARSPLDALGASFSTIFGRPIRAGQRLVTEQDPWYAARELMPTAVQHWMDFFDPGGAMSAARSGRPYLAPGDLTTADRFKMALGFQPAIKTEKFEEHQRFYQTEDVYRNQLTVIENSIANLMARGQDTSSAIAQAQQTIVEGVRAGVLDPRTAVADFQRQIMAKMMQRLAPDIGSRSEQRYRAQNPNP